MLDIVVCASSTSFMTKNIGIINIALSEYNIDYRIHKFFKYDEELDFIIKNGDKKIYIVDSCVDKVSDLNLVNVIRKSDWDSIIMIATLYGKDNSRYSRMLVFDYVYKGNSYKHRLIEDIKMAISILDVHQEFVFKYNRIIYRIPYDKICYIEKEANIKRCIIHTINNQYYITASIDSIISRLNNCFCKTHQACIVNLCNIAKINLSTNTIIFKNGDKTDMLTMKMKREVKRYLDIS